MKKAELIDEIWKYVVPGEETYGEFIQFLLEETNIQRLDRLLRKLRDPYVDVGERVEKLLKDD